MVTYTDNIIEELVRQKFMDLIVSEALLLPSGDQRRELLGSLLGKARDLDLEIERPLVSWERVSGGRT